MASIIISKNVLEEMIKNDKENLVIVDLREKEEYEQFHIKDAINYSYNLLMKTNNFGENITKNKQIIVYCERGGRSIYAARRLRVLGYNASSLLGGLENYLKN
ncbi:MAG: rhodanese-like domain-containing protein [Lachnospiraceae bacterium]|nr:rhodanese-like domain-containing protein [Lachnospiraceae bacterium]